ncbi:MAG: DEAD/DEAH box helicase [Candidatus Saliniplasma sp.]
MTYYEHPLVKDDAIEERDYQLNIAEVAKGNSTLVVIPTGMGKTIIAFLVMADVKLKDPDGKILFLAPTKPLVNQHARDIKEVLEVDEPKVFTGDVKPEERSELWEQTDIIVSTPQVIRNDLMAHRISLDDVSFLVFDEAHRAVGGYSYVYIADQYKKRDGLVLGLTASPGSETEHILSVCETLGIENVEIRTKYDPDVVNYIQKMDINWIDVKLPKKHKRVVERLKDILIRDIKKLQRYGFLKDQNPKRTSRKKIIEASNQIQGRLHSGDDPKLYNAASIVASALKIDHAIDQAETQGPDVLKDYLDKLKNEAESRGGSKASRRIMNSKEMNEVLALLKNFDEDHPKIPKTVEVVNKQLNRKPDSRIIVFTNYRNTAQRLTRILAEEEGVKPIRFVGQADKEGDKGLKQREQLEAIRRFEDGTYNVLVATSVGEEGLDIPATDLVVFYEPVPSEIRTIQRRGRTARERKGKVAILITKNTRDEAYYWSSKNKEKNMNRNLKILKRDLEDKVSVGESMRKKENDFKVVKKKSKKELARTRDSYKEKKNEDQRSLMDFERGEEKKKSDLEEVGDEVEEEVRDKGEKEEVPSLTIDMREQNSKVVTEISKKGIRIDTAQLSVGDYIISEDTAVERKSVEDFLESLIDGRLFSQAKSLKEQYISPIIILEGEGLHHKRNISDNAVYGALASIINDFRIPVVSTKNEEETASLISALVSRKKGVKRSTSVRKDKESMSTFNQKKFIIEGLPSISGTLAERLLDHFGNVRSVFKAGVDELREVKGIGPETAERIVKLLDDDT